MLLGEALREARTALASASESPRLDAEILLAFTLARGRASLAAASLEALNSQEQSRFDALVQRRAAGIPVAYLTGRREFWSLELTVTADVLIPRPETEILVERALELLPDCEECAVLDLGTGSGAIALAIASERPRCRVTGTDVSPAALAVARKNAQRLGFTRIEWQTGSWFDTLAGRRFDLIACNPPYVAANDPHIARLHAEPRHALTPGATGLEAFEAIIPAAAQHLTGRGWVVFEHGATQAAAVANLLEQQGFHHVISHPDYAGLPRITLAALHSSPKDHHDPL